MRARPFKRAILFACSVLAILFACTDASDVSAPGKPYDARIGFAPRYVYLGNSSYVGEPINRIRLTARNMATNVVVGTLVVDVDPTAQDWNLAVDVELEGPIDVQVTIELINVTSGVEAVQWSGISEPISVSPSQPLHESASVTLYQGPPENLGVTGIALPDSLVLQEGSSTVLTPNIVGPPTAVAIWSSEDASIATVDQTGRVTGVRDGVARVIAVAGPKSDTARVRVTQRVSAITVAPDTQRINSVGAQATFTARSFDPRGTEVSGSAVTWSVADANVLESLGNGVFRAKAAGTSRIFATSVAQPTVRDTGIVIVSQVVTTLNVTPAVDTVAPADTARFTTTARDANNNVATGAAITWSSSDTTIATVDASGLARGRRDGAVTLTARSGTVSAQAALVVRTPGPQRVVISPDSAHINALGFAVQLSAAVLDIDGTPMTNQTVTWSTLDPSRVNVDNNGRVTALAVGRARVIANVNPADTAIVEVVQVPARITVTPATQTLAIGDSVVLGAAVTDSNNIAVPGITVSWRSSDSTIVHVNSAGVARALRAGGAVITASYLDRSGTASINVNAPDLAVLSITTVPADTLVDGDSVRVLLSVTNQGNAAAAASQVAVQVRDAATGVVLRSATLPLPLIPAGVTLPLSASLALTPDVAWPDSVTGRVVLDSLNTVVESNENNNAAVTSARVVRYAIATLTLAPDTLRLVGVGATGQLTAAARDRLERACSCAVSFVSRNPAIATVDGSGLVSGVVGGSTWVVATAGAKADSAFVIVSLPNLHVSSVRVEPDSLTVGAAATVTSVIRNPTATAVASFDFSLTIINQSTDTANSRVVIFQSDLAVPAHDSVVVTHNFVVDTLTNWTDSVSVQAHADAANAINESDEGDNSASTARVAVRFPVRRVVITPDTLRLNTIGSSAPLTAQAFDHKGRVLSRTMAYASANPGIATVDANGLVTAHAEGVTSVVAQSEGKADTSVVIVSSANLVVRSLTVTPNTLMVGGSAVVTGVIANTGTANAAASVAGFRVLNATGNAIVVGSMVPVPAIAAGDSGVVSVPLNVDTLIAWPDSVKGALTLDSTNVVAESNEADNSLITAAHTVRYPVATIQLPHDTLYINAIQGVASVSAVVQDRLGRTLTDRTIAYSAQNDGVASIDSAGSIRAHAVGSAFVYAQSESAQDSMLVIVRQIPASLSVTPDSARLVLGDSTQLSVAVSDSTGHATSVAVTWQSQDSTVATVDANGRVRAVGNGTTTVTASHGALSAGATIRVMSANLVVRSLGVTPATLNVGGAAVVTGVVANTGTANAAASVAGFRVLNAAGNAIVMGSMVPVPAIAAGDSAVLSLPLNVDTLIVWPDSVRGAVTLDSTNVVAESNENDNAFVTAAHAIRYPAATVQLSADTVYINAIDGLAVISAVVRDRTGRVLTDRAVTFSSQDGGIAGIDSTGHIRGNAPGSVFVFAQAETARDSALVIVRQVPASLSVTPDSALLVLGDSTQLSVAVSDSTGHATSVPVTWQSQDSTIATVDANGRVRAVGNGTTTITASHGALSDGATIRVTSANLVVRSLSVAPATLNVGGAAVVTGVVANTGTANAAASVAGFRVLNAAGNALVMGSMVPVPAIAAGDSAVLSIPLNLDTLIAWPDSVRGAVTLDSTHVVAESNEGDNSFVSATHAVRYPVASVQLPADSLYINAIDGVASVAAVVRDRLGRTLTDRVVSFASRNTVVATIDSTGLIRAKAVGKAFIVAHAESARDSMLVIVRQVPANLSVTPDSALLVLGDSAQLTATVRDSASHGISVAVTWQSQDTTVARVDGNGRVRAVGQGTTTVRASLGSLSDATIVRVTAANLVVRRLAVTPETLNVGGSAVVSGVVANTGSAPAAASVVGFRVLNAAGNAVLIGSMVPVPAIAAGDSALINIPLEVDTLIAWPDSVKGAVTLDSTRVVNESNEADNTFVTAAHAVRYPVASIQLPADTIYINALDGLAFVTAVVRDRMGRVLSGRPVVFTSADNGIAGVDSTGHIRGNAVGSAFVYAQSESARDSALVIVRQIPATLSVAPDSALLLLGDSALLTATVQDSTAHDVSATLTWQAQDTTIATVDGNGRVRAVRNGTTTITTSHGTLSDVTTIRVIGANLVVRSLTVTPDTLDVGGTAIVSGVFANTGSAAAPATVAGFRVLNAAGGAVVMGSMVPVASIAAGDSVTINIPLSVDTLVAWPDSVKGAVDLDTTKVVTESNEADNGFVSTAHAVRYSVAAVTLAPDTLRLAGLGTQGQLTATLRDRLGRVLNRPVTFASQDTMVARVDQSGNVIAYAAGTTAITATSEARTGSAVVLVTVPDLIVSSLVVNPDTLAEGGAFEVRYTVGNRGDAAAGATNAEIRLIDESRHVVMKSYTIATAAIPVGGSVSVVAPLALDTTIAWPDSILIDVYADADLGLPEGDDSNNHAYAQRVVRLRVASIEMGADTIYINGIDSLAFVTPVLRDRLERIVTGRPVVFSAQNDSIASIDTSGRIRANRVGSAFVFAQSETVRDSALVIVRAPNLTVRSLTVTPDTLAEGTPATVRGVVANNGSAPAAASQIGFRVLNAGNGALVRGGLLPVPAIAAGDSAVINIPLNVDTLTAWPDSLKGQVFVDSTNVVRESNESDNRYTSAAHVVRFRVVSVVMTPDSLSLDRAGETGQLTAVARDQHARPLARPVTFSSADTVVAVVDANGLVTARGAGRTTVTAGSDGRTDASVIVVRQSDLVVAALDISPDSAVEGGQLALAVRVANIGDGSAGASETMIKIVDAGTDAILLTSQLTTNALPAGDTTLVQTTITLDGGTAWPDSVRVRVYADFTAAISESNEANNVRTSASLPVTLRVAAVVLPFDTLYLNALGSEASAAATTQDRHGRPLTDRPINYSTANGAIAGIDTTGRVRGNGLGSAFVFAVSGSARDSMLVIVRQIPAQIAVAPDSAALVLGDSVQLNATITDSTGHSITASPVWQSRDATIATVDSNGRVRSVRTGSTTIVASYGGLADSAAISVQAPNLIVRSFTVTPDTLQEGGVATLRGVVVNTGNAAAPGWQLGFQLVDAGTGVTARAASMPVTPLGAGDSSVISIPITLDTLTAWPDSLKGVLIADSTHVVLESNEADNRIISSAHTVRLRVARLALSPSRMVLNAIGDTARITATTYDRNGRVLTDRPVSFASRSSSDVTVDNSGLVTAVSPDSAYVLVGSETRTDSVLVVVEQQVSAVAPLSSALQVAVVDQEAPDSLGVIVKDGNGHGVAGVTVNWSTQPASTTVTNADGIAKAKWKFGTRAGPQQLEACVLTFPCVVFNGNAKADKPHGGSKKKGDEQLATVGTIAGDSLVLEVTDRFGNAVPDAVVKWLANGGGTVSDSMTTTDSLGIAMVQFTVGTVKGRKTIDANVLDGANVVATQQFKLNGKAGAPHGGSKKKGGGLTAVVAPALGDSLEVQIVDQYGNGVDSIAVTFEVQAGGGKIGTSTAQTVITDTAGQARVHWTLGTKAGRHRLRARVDGTAITIEFENEAKADKPRGGSKKKGDEQLAIVGTIAGDSLVLEVTDQYANVVPDAVVEWTSNGGTLSDSTTTTDSLGVTMVQFAIGTVKGQKTVDAKVMDGANVVATEQFKLNGKAGAPHGGSKKKGGGLTAVVAPTLGDSLEVQIVDQYGNGVDSVSVTFEVLGGGGKIGTATAQTVIADSDGFASVLWTLGTKAGRHKLRVSVDGTPIAIDFENDAKADKPHGGAKKKGDDQFGTVGTVAGDSLILEVTDQYNNVVPNAVVRWNATGGTVSAPTSTTDSLGITMVQFTIGTVKGPKTVVAEVLDSVTVVASQQFRLNGKAGAPHGANKNKGGGLTAVVAPTLGDSLEVQIIDEYGNGVDSVSVTFEVQGGGGKVGTADAQTVITDSNGFARIFWTLGTRAGAHKLRVTVDGTSVSVDFDNTARAAGPKKGNRKTESNDQSVVVTQVAPTALELTVTDEYENPVDSALVEWAIDGRAAGILSDSSTRTNSAGKAIVTWTAPTRSGTYYVRYSIKDSTGVATDTGSFRAHARPDAPRRHEKNPASDDQEVEVTQIAPNALELMVSDTFGNVVEGALVTFMLRDTMNGASLSANLDTTDVNGKAAVSWNVGRKSGRVYVDYTVRYNGVEYATGTFSANARAGRAAKSEPRSGEDQTGVVGSQLNGDILIDVKDAFDNPVAGVRVDWDPGPGSVDDTDRITYTDSLGVTGLHWTLGTQKGTQTLVAVVHLTDSTTATLTFTATAKPGNPNNQPGLRLSTGAPLRAAQTRVVESTADVLDQYGNVLESVDLEWGLCAGASVCATPVASLPGVGSIAAKLPPTAPPSADLILDAAASGTFTVVARKGAVLAGSLTLTIQ